MEKRVKLAIIFTLLVIVLLVIYFSRDLLLLAPVKDLDVWDGECDPVDGIVPVDGECSPIGGGSGQACGNGVIEGSENCDGSLGGATCQGLGFSGGILVCDECWFDITSCIPFSCSDSDNGLSYYSVGQVITESQTLDDNCLDSTNLQEFYCNNEMQQSANYACPNGCLNGACAAECNTNPDCPPNEFCINFECVVLCGNGVVDSGEGCDAGVNNGVVCTPSYNSQCNYCDSNCQQINLAGGICGDNIVNSGFETCDDGNTNNGDGCSSSCSVEVVQQGGGNGGSGGGGGGATLTTRPLTGNRLIEVTPSEIKVESKNKQEIILQLKIVNKGSSNLDLSLTITDSLKNIVSLDRESFTIGGGKVENVAVKILYKEGLSVGRISVRASNGQVLEVPATILFNTGKNEYQSKIKVLPQFKIADDDLEVSVNVKQLVELLKQDVVANYIVKDFEGNNYLEFTETYFVEGEKNYGKKFDVSALPDGKYVVALEIVYPGGFSVSSDEFEVVRSARKNYLWIYILLELFFFAFIHKMQELYRKRKKRKKR